MVALFSVFFWLCHGACRISFSQSRIEPQPQQWKPGIPTTRPLGNSLFLVFKVNTVLFSTVAAPVYIPTSGYRMLSLFRTPKLSQMSHNQSAAWSQNRAGPTGKARGDFIHFSSLKSFNTLQFFVSLESMFSFPAFKLTSGLCLTSGKVDRTVKKCGNYFNNTLAFFLFWWQGLNLRFLVALFWVIRCQETSINTIYDAGWVAASPHMWTEGPIWCWMASWSSENAVYMNFPRVYTYIVGFFIIDICYRNRGI